jgi:DNA-binding NtrC family response regulator
MLKDIRASYPDLPIILIGRRCQVDVAVRVLKLGRVEYLARPLSPRRLRDKIEDAVERRAYLRELTRRRAAQAGG